MRNLNVSISDLEYCKFGLKNDNLSFTELVDLIGRELTKRSMDRSIELSERFGLSKMTMDEISREVKAVRKNAKGNP
jgi:hypothetical protein